MFSRSSALVFLAISLCVQAVPHTSPSIEQCDAISTVIKTVTVTAQASSATDNGSAVRVGDGSHNDATTTSATSAASTSHVGDNNDNHGGHTTSSSTASAATATEGHDDSNKNGKGSTTTKTSASSTSIASTAASTNTVTSVNNNNSSNSGNNNSSDAQTSLTLNPAVIATGFADNGQDVPTAGQVASLTSTNNFINFCLTVPNLNITNGQQITAGSCNPAPMGIIPSSSNMPSAKFTFPKNFGTIQANQTFNIEMAIQNMQTGFFVNADENYFAAPQQVNAQGQIQGHSHVVIEALSSLGQTTPTNPKNFVFFKGLNSPAANGILNATVSDGLGVGFYKLSSINTAANHQPLLVPIAQHGSLDDAIYFSVTSDGVAASNGTNGESVTLTTSAGESVTTPPLASFTSANAAAATVSTQSNPHNDASASVSSQNSNLPASKTSLSSATVVPAKSAVAGTDNGNGRSATSSSIPASTSLASTKGKRELRNRFILKL